MVDGFPHTREQWSVMLEQQVVPDHVLALGEPDGKEGALLERIKARATGDGAVSEPKLYTLFISRYLGTIVWMSGVCISACTRACSHRAICCFSRRWRKLGPRSTRSSGNIGHTSLQPSRALPLSLLRLTALLNWKRCSAVLSWTWKVGSICITMVQLFCSISTSYAECKHLHHSPPV